MRRPGPKTLSGATAARKPALLTFLALVACACDDGKTVYMGAHMPFAGCVVNPTTPPAELKLDPFYGKYLDGYGTPVVSSSQVSDQALVAACRITGEMVSARKDVRDALAARHFRVAVLALGERTTDIPEYADLYSAFPGTEWNEIRGLGATRARPVSSCAEENLLCLPSDIYPGETILVEMIAHGHRDLGIVDVDAQFRGHLQSVYALAMSKGLWNATSAAVDADTYWAVGAAAWFGASTLTPVNTPATVTDYDPPLAALLAAYLPAVTWHPGCY
jgi:hypothetical protein